MQSVEEIQTHMDVVVCHVIVCTCPQDTLLTASNVVGLCALKPHMWFVMSAGPLLAHWLRLLILSLFTSAFTNLDMI